ncbi:toprim domain-containing protein [bacterium]|nr:MAG: toprim domain-containing protein [bacterium]
MKIQSSNTKKIYNYTPEGLRSLCPECSHQRKKAKDKCLAWDEKEKRGYCHNCGTAFFEYRPHEPKQFIIPKWKNKTELTNKAVKYFEGRMISQIALNKMRVYSEKVMMPQFKGEIECICFPYFYDNKLINIKYRGPKKSFRMVSGAELIFWNIDCLAQNKEIVIVEGEIDALTFIQAGYENTLSVPNGANKNLEYLDNCIDMFADIERIYIAIDQDTKGIELRGELVRRLGAERCWIVSFKDCKDANEYLLKYGPAIQDVLSEAKPVPVKGIIEIKSLYAEIRNLFENGIQPGKKINQNIIDEKVTWETGRLVIVTGIPASGKSEFVDHIVCKLNIIHGWKAGYFTPENYPLKFHYTKLFEKIIGKKFSKDKVTETEWDNAYEYISNNYFYILNEEDFTVKSILDSAKVLIKTRGIKIIVIDPYNKLEHKYMDSETQYISRFLDDLITFAKINDILIFLIAHPRKMNKSANGKTDVPSLYDISGSANFYNKTDYGITVHRNTDDQNVMLNSIKVYFQKIKYKHLGEQGIIELQYDFITGRFNQLGRDMSNWLTDQQPLEQIINYYETETQEAPF